MYFVKLRQQITDIYVWYACGVRGITAGLGFLLIHRRIHQIELVKEGER
jgi:hypothetical protein